VIGTPRRKLSAVVGNAEAAAIRLRDHSSFSLCVLGSQLQAHIGGVDARIGEPQ
jgi:hypothetical protein